MIKGFKEFTIRGNVIDLAVAIVIGAAFTTIVGQVTEAVINPLVAIFFSADSLDTALQVTVPTLAGGEVTFSFGAVIGAAINFLIVAAVVYFVFVVPTNKLKERTQGPIEEVESLPSEQELLVQIRDLLEKNNADSKE